MKFEQIMIIFVGICIIIDSIMIIGIPITLVSLILPLIYFIIQDRTSSVSAFQNTPVQIGLIGTFLIFIACISFTAVVAFILYLIFWAEGVHLWLKYDE